RERSSILTNAVGTAMVMLFFLDVASFGFFCEWRGIEADSVERLADTPTVKYIKERERDLNSFRVISYSLQPHGRNSDLLDYPNISIPRGLQSANGYDPIYLSRYKTMAGDMSTIGVVLEPGVFGLHDQSFNLLNLKYLLFERPDLMGGANYIVREGIRFLADPIYLSLAPGKQADIDVKTTATELALISAMGTSNHVPNGAPVVNIALYTKDGHVIERRLLAGQHTSEWSYDFPYQHDPPRHARAPVAENIPVEGFEGHYYLGRFPFERSEIERVVFKYELHEANVTFWRASFHDAATGQSTALGAVGLPADRWRKLTQFGDVEVYENTKALPRAWFARRAAIESSADTLQIIKTGKMKDGSPFDPAETVLFEKGDVGDRDSVPQIGDPSNAEAKVTRYEPQRIELQTENSQPGFLVLSEIYYSGWDAWIDGHRTPVERVNYLLRGLAVPAGDHRIEFVFRAHSFRTGAVCSLLGALILLLCASNRTRRVLTKAESRLEAPATRLLISTESKIREWIIEGKLITGALDIVGPKLSALSKSRFIIVVAVAGFLIYGYFLARASYEIGAVGATVSWVVNPMQGLLSIFLIYRVGLELGLPRGFSMAGAIMIAGSPTFIFMSTQPTSDSVAMSWSLSAILAALLSRKRDGWASLAGLAFSMAIFTGPSGVLLLIPILFSLRLKFKNILYFILGVLSPAMMSLIYNGANHPLMAWRRASSLQDPVTITGFIERFNFYRYWIKVTMSPLPLIGWLAVAADRKVEWRNRAILVSWFGVFFLFYSFYDIYTEKAWWNTRLLLPAYPAMILGSLLVARDLSGLLGKRISEVNKARLSWIVLTIFLAVTFSHQRRNIRRFDAFNVGRREIAIILPYPLLRIESGR
ncbi:MAG: YfhO family protein, partial [Chloracidobacterium sp.]|nr:YfhO family protein [Chloracidobacterium sp.]